VIEGGLRRFVPGTWPRILGTFLEQVPAASDELRDWHLLDTEKDIAEVVVLEVVGENTFKD